MNAADPHPSSEPPSDPWRRRKERAAILRRLDEMSTSIARHLERTALNPKVPPRDRPPRAVASQPPES